MIKAVIFDYAGTIYNPFTGKLYPELIPVLNYLIQKGLKLALISRATNLEERLEEFEDLNLRKYFQILEAIPVGNKKDFRRILKKLSISPEETLVIGDRVKSEILEGNKIGAKTVWVLQGEFLDESPENELEKPNYIIHSLDELLTINNIFE